MIDRRTMLRVVGGIAVCCVVACASPRPTTTKATPSAPRNIAKMADVDAPVSVVWNTWTTTNGVQTFLSPQAKLEAGVGGPFELLFNPEAPEGARGTEGCTVLSITPETRLTFEIGFPPSLGLGDQKTPVTIHLTALDEMTTRIKIVHQGFTSGAAWDNAHFYYSEFWSTVADHLRQRFSEGPIVWESARDHFEWR